MKSKITFIYSMSNSIIMPDSSYKFTWDIIVFLTVLYQCVVIPYRIWFDDPAVGALYFIEGTMDLMFIIDVVLTFNWGYYSKGIPVLKRK